MSDESVRRYQDTSLVEELGCHSAFGQTAFVVDHNMDQCQVILEAVHYAVVVDTWLPEHVLAMSDTVPRFIHRASGHPKVPSQAHHTPLLAAVTVTRPELRI